MAKLIMLKGLPGSGKSTWANQYITDHSNAIRVNKDDLRRMLRGPKWSKALEPGVLVTRDNIISWALANGKDVIVDDTNFAPKHEERLRELACTMEAEFEVKFIDTPLRDCIKNDLHRLNSVGEKVIRRMYNQYMNTESPRVVPVCGADNAIICDLDGTLCLHNGRSPYDTEKCEQDGINWPVWELLFRNWAKKIIFVSGRDEQYREKTTNWLKTHLEWLKDWELYMRPHDNREDDSIVKRALFDQYIRGKYNVDFVLDDRTRVVDMWRSLGLTCFQVAEGEF